MKKMKRTVSTKECHCEGEIIYRNEHDASKKSCHMTKDTRMRGKNSHHILRQNSPGEGLPRWRKR